MKSINELMGMSRDVSYEIKKAFRAVEYKNDEDFQDVDTSELSADDIQKVEELRKAFGKLEDFNYIIEYLTSPVKSEGTIYENENGRYALSNGFEFTSGNQIEALVYDSFYDKNIWVRTSVESNEDGYYLVGRRNVSMEGLRVRIR